MILEYVGKATWAMIHSAPDVMWGFSSRRVFQISGYLVTWGIKTDNNINLQLVFHRTCRVNHESKYLLNNVLFPSDFFSPYLLAPV